MSKSIAMPRGTANIKALFDGCFVAENGTHRTLTDEEKQDLVSAVEKCFSKNEPIIVANAEAYNAQIGEENAWLKQQVLDLTNENDQLKSEKEEAAMAAQIAAEEAANLVADKTAKEAANAKK